MVARKIAVLYLCVIKSGRTMYWYSSGDEEVESLAAVCQEQIPHFHSWYFETFGGRKFVFMLEDGYVYFAVVDICLRNAEILQFLQQFRDEYRRLSRKTSRGSFSTSSPSSLQEQLLPIVGKLISSLQQISGSSEWQIEVPPSYNVSPTEPAISSKAPLLGKKTKDHVIMMRESEAEEDRKSTERSSKAESPVLGSNSQVSAASGSATQKEFGPMRSKSSSQLLRRRWWRRVRIILAVDAAVCLVLVGVWLGVCHRFECLR